MADSGTGWSYSNNFRVLTAFLGVPMVLLGLGLVLVAFFGKDATDGATMLLGLAVFVTMFALLLVFPRLLRRGVWNYGRIVDRPMDVVEAVVRGALEGTGRPVRTEEIVSRSKRRLRIVRVEGLSTHFMLESFSGPARETEGEARTEIVQVGISGEVDPGAKALRDLVESRLAMSEDRPA